MRFVVRGEVPGSTSGAMFYFFIAYVVSGVNSAIRWFRHSRTAVVVLTKGKIYLEVEIRELHSSKVPLLLLRTNY